MDRAAGHDARLYNGYCVQLVGRPLEVLREKGWLDFVHPDDVERCLATYMPALKREAVSPGVSPSPRRRRLPVAAGDRCSKIRSGRQFHRRCRLRHRHHRTEERRGSDPREPGALEASHQEIESLAGRLIGAQEVERARIARDLHDDVSQQLAGVSIAFSGLKQRLGEYHVSEELRQELVELQQQTLKLARNVRQLSESPSGRAATPGAGEGSGFLLWRARRAHGVAMTCTAEGDFGAITPDAALCMYRIAQEALRNVVAHARASHADVRLLQVGDQARITIADDGQGFDARSRVQRDTGLGLVSMSERARIMGGTVSILSGLNQGTRVQATIPMHVQVDVGSGMPVA